MPGVLGSIALTLPAAVYAVLAIIALFAGAYGVNRFTRGLTIKSVTETAAADVARLKDMIDVLKGQREDDLKKIASLEGQIETLRQMVTQAAKVEELRKLVLAQHQETLAEIRKAVPK